MRVGRAILCGVLGASIISFLTGLFRGAGLLIQMEMILGTLFGVPPGGGAFFLGLLVHLGIGAGFGVLYAWLFERVWKHGGAPMGMIIGFIHALFIGILFGFTPQFHPFIPTVLVDPGPYFTSEGVWGALAFFFVHLVFGCVVGAGYGHVPAERAWAPTGQA